MDDAGLRRLVAQHVPKEAKIIEAKVMRDMTRKVSGVAASKEFGFVSLAKHEHALLALRNMNNNPDIFGPDKRPIVDFSIENRKALLARQKREEKSRTNNPNFKGSCQI
jgi:nucleolar protein 4